MLMIELLVSVKSLIKIWYVWNITISEEEFFFLIFKFNANKLTLVYLSLMTFIALFSWKQNNYNLFRIIIRCEPSKFLKSPFVNQRCEEPGWTVLVLLLTHAPCHLSPKLHLTWLSVRWPRSVISVSVLLSITIDQILYLYT